MITPWSPTPDWLLSYFQDLASRQPGVEEWINGARLARRWIDLMAGPSPQQTEVENLLCEIAANPDPGSGWVDLWLRVAHWARALGIAVPEEHPWVRAVEKGRP